MSDAISSADPQAHPGHDPMTSMLFGSLVMQQSNMALMFLGRTPHPETGQPMQDLEAARMFIDQLEMLDTKTKGNLTKDEQQMLTNTLTSLRMAFVEAINQGKPSQPATSSSSSSSPGSSAAEAGTPPQPGAETNAESSAATEPDAESKKKFTKKY